MAVFQEQDSGGCRFTIRPNCALSWRATKYLVLFFACCFGAIGIYFASLGAWLVLPFAGLELFVLAGGFYFSSLAGHTREVIEIEGPVARVLRGGRRPEQVAVFPANWTQVVLHRDPRGWYPSRLLLRCHGRGLEIGTKIVEAEKEELAAVLGNWLGFANSPDGQVAAAATRSARESPSQELPAGWPANAYRDEGMRIGADVGIPPRKNAARSAGSEC
jgi:uncharacterized membrane protein